MGLGDEIMALGHAETVSRRDYCGSPVAIVDRRGMARKHDLWRGSPFVTMSPGPNTPTVTNAAQYRPYIRYPFTRETGITPSGWRARDYRGRLVLTDEELEAGRRLRAQLGPFVILGAEIGPGASPNKDWGRARFESLVSLLSPHMAVVQSSAPRPEFTAIPGVRRHLKLHNFRQVCGVLAASTGYVGVEGGLHHAAAALGLPGTVIFGHFIDPLVTGYPEHRNLRGGAIGMCGSWSSCGECERAMEAVTPETVAEVTLSWAF